MKSFLIVSALCGLAATAPAGTSPNQFEIFTINNNFETTMNAIPVTGTILPTGVYNLLYWNVPSGDKARRDEHSGEIADIAERQVVVAGVEPHTPPNVFGFNIRSTVMNGKPYITSTYATSNVDHFDLYVPDYAAAHDRNTVYFGCILGAVSQAALPTSCTITVTGFDAAGQKVATKDLVYKSFGGVKQPMQGDSFPAGFVGLERVEFAVDDPLKFVTMDNLVTRVYQKKSS